MQIMESSLNPWGQDTHTRKPTIPRNVNDVKGFGLEKITKMLKEVILIFCSTFNVFCSNVSQDNESSPSSI